MEKGNKRPRDEEEGKEDKNPPKVLANTTPITISSASSNSSPRTSPSSSSSAMSVLPDPNLAEDYAELRREGATPENCQILKNLMKPGESMTTSIERMMHIRRYVRFQQNRLIDSLTQAPGDQAGPSQSTEQEEQPAPSTEEQEALMQEEFESVSQRGGARRSKSKKAQPEKDEDETPK